MSDEILTLLRHILDACIDNAHSLDTYNAWCTARDIIEYALAENYECLKEFDYMETKEEVSQ